jgi:hypothetical protein
LTVFKPITDEPIALHMIEDSKIIYESLSRAAGINVLARSRHLLRDVLKP